MTLEFKSDTMIGGKGFLIEWMAVQGSGPLPTIEPGSFPKDSSYQILLKFSKNRNCMISFHNWSLFLSFQEHVEEH